MTGEGPVTSAGWIGITKAVVIGEYAVTLGTVYMVPCGSAADLCEGTLLDLGNLHQNPLGTDAVLTVHKKCCLLPAKSPQPLSIMGCPSRLTAQGTQDAYAETRGFL